MSADKESRGRETLTLLKPEEQKSKHEIKLALPLLV